MPDPKASSPPPQQLLIAFDSMRLRGLSLTERRQAITRLATLLLEASGAAREGRNDDQR